MRCAPPLDDAFPPPLAQLHTRHAEICKQLGDLAAAAASYEAASEAALEAGQPKLGMKLQALAEGCAPDE